MPNATYRVHVLGRGGRRSAVGMAAYGSGKTLRVRSVLAAAAYRAGETLRDYSQEQFYDYSDRDDVRYEAILAPSGAPAWARDREALWNAVEQRETRRDAQLARSIVIALPRELDLEQNMQLLRAHVADAFVARGMIADMAIHDKQASDGGSNPHAHILLTLREIDAGGDWAGRKNREWNDPGLVQQWRDSWEAQQNAALEAAEVEERISMQSYADRGINRVPQAHIGPRADLLEKQGVETFVGEHNRDIVQENQVRALLDVMRPMQQWEAALEPDMAWGLLPSDEIARIEEHMQEEAPEHGAEAERE